jgi:hypothetical protein
MDWNEGLIMTISYSDRTPVIKKRRLPVVTKIICVNRRNLRINGLFFPFSILTSYSISIIYQSPLHTDSGNSGVFVRPENLGCGAGERRKNHEQPALVARAPRRDRTHPLRISPPAHTAKSVLFLFFALCVFFAAILSRPGGKGRVEADVHSTIVLPASAGFAGLRRRQGND